MIRISFENPILSEEELKEITEDDLCDCGKDKVFEGFNQFFVLLATYTYYEQENNKEAAAYASYLLSWYLFVPLTPPGSEILALQYANKAYELNPMQKYADHIEFVKNGN